MLKNNLQRLACRTDFDAILIDCPPSLGLLTQNAVAAATAMIIPIQCEYYPLEGLVQLLAAIRELGTINADLKVGGILLTMVDPKADLAREVEAEVRSKLKERVFRTVIPTRYRGGRGAEPLPVGHRLRSKICWGKGLRAVGAGGRGRRTGRLKARNQKEMGDG